jgi:hypothetical protein
MYRLTLLWLIPSLLFSQPAPVTIDFPSDNSVGLINPIKFTWATSMQALAYTIQVSVDSAFGSCLVSQSISDTTYSTSVLQTSTRYYWRVRAENIGGASDWTNAMLTTKLNTTSLSKPDSGGVNVNLKPTLIWSGVLPSARYTLELSIYPDYSIITQCIDTTSTSATLDSLGRATTYYWRARAYIQGDTTEYSNSWSFVTLPFYPAAPNLIVPEDASTNTAVNVVLRWSKVQNATSYDLQVSASPIFSTLLKDSSFSDTLYRPKPFFASNTQCFWRVNATNGAGTSAYSGTYRYTTGTDTNKAKISFQNINIGTVKAGTVKDAAVTITNAGNDDLIIYSLSKPLSSWTAVDSGLTNTSVHTLAVSGTNVFAGTDGGVFLSTNNGVSWIAMNNGLTSIGVNRLAVSPNVAGNTNVFAGGRSSVSISTNSGTSWTDKSTGLPNNPNIALAFSNTNLFAGFEYSGIYRSTDNGTSWNAANTGLGNRYPYAFAVSGTNLFVGTMGGIFLSTNNGASWTGVSNGLPSSAYIYALEFFGSTLFASIGGNDGSGIFLSTNSGTTWSPSMTGLTNSFGSAFAISDGSLFAGFYGIGVYRSTDNGTSWSSVNNGLTNDNIQCLAVNGPNLFVATGDGIFRSSFIDLSASISTSIIIPGTSTSASIHFNSMPVGAVNGKIVVSSNAPSSPDTITVTGFGATYGMTLNSKKMNMGTVRVGQAKDTIITFVNTGNDDLVISNIVSDNQMFTLRPSAFTIVAGASAKDTIRFTPIAAGNAIGQIIINSNASSSPDTVIVNASGSLTGVITELGLPTAFSLSQNFPNPFNPSTTLHYGLPSRSRVRLQVFNILGQVVTDLVNADQAAGWNQVVWNANVASGLYFYRLEAVSVSDPNKRFVDVKKMILLK